MAGCVVRVASHSLTLVVLAMRESAGAYQPPAQLKRLPDFPPW